MRGRRGYRRGWYGVHGCGPMGWRGERPSEAETVEMLEEYQRDLEQEVEDVAQRIREIRDKIQAKA